MVGADGVCGSSVGGSLMVDASFIFGWFLGGLVLSVVVTFLRDAARS